MRTLPLLLALLLPGQLGCTRDEAPPQPKKAQPAPQPEPPPPPEPEPPPPPPEPKAQKPQPIGVPECDGYVAKYSACLEEKVPAGARASMERMLRETEEQWQKAAKQPGGKRQLARACKTAFDAMTTSMKAFGCEW